MHHVPTPAPPTTTTKTTTTTTAAPISPTAKSNVNKNISQNEDHVMESIASADKQYNVDTDSYKVTNNGFTQRAEDDLVIGIMTSAGYFLIIIILIIGIGMGDEITYTVTNPSPSYDLFEFHFNILAFLIQFLWMFTFHGSWCRTNKCLQKCHFGKLQMPLRKGEGTFPFI